MPSELDRPILRQDAILDAALKAFATYGYRRTTMDDIAKGVGISRSALYMHYRSKEDILRSLAARYFEEAVESVATELGSPNRPAAEALAAAFVGYDGKFMDIVFGTAHGAEMLDAGHLVSSDLVEKGEAQIHAILVDWLKTGTIPADLGVAETLATTVLASLKGLKGVAKSSEGYRAAQAQLATVVARALGR